MFDNLVSIESINFILVFIEGILSFFSPCVLPLIPIYISYLAGNAKEKKEDGSIIYIRKKVFFHTLFFVLGISFAFFILGFSFSALGIFFNKNKLLFTRIGGILIIILGLFQLGIINFNFLQREKKFHLNLNIDNMNPLVAFVMGFTFSFAWTPCVGPALSSVLILASNAKNAVAGNLLVLIYTLGFIIPFLILGLFTTQALNFFKSKQKFLKYTIKIGGTLLVLIGIMTFTGWMNGITSYLNSFVGSNYSNGNQTETTTQQQESTKSSDEQTNNEATIEAFDFELKDQYGNTHKLSDYKGKVVFLNFWATWCPPCRSEMPHIEELYNEYNLNQDDVIILGVANPKTEQNPNGSDGSIDEIKEFLDKEGYTFPVAFDETGEVFINYFINSFPTTFMIDKDGNIFGYISGALTKDIMIDIINQTIENKRRTN